MGAWLGKMQPGCTNFPVLTSSPYCIFPFQLSLFTGSFFTTDVTPWTTFHLPVFNLYSSLSFAAFYVHGAYMTEVMVKSEGMLRKSVPSKWVPGSSSRCWDLLASAFAWGVISSALNLLNFRNAVSPASFKHFTLIACSLLEDEVRIHLAHSEPRTYYEPLGTSIHMTMTRWTTR